jgi:hypothetical protein
MMQGPPYSFRVHQLFGAGHDQKKKKLFRLAVEACPYLLFGKSIYRDDDTSRADARN